MHYFLVPEKKQVNLWVKCESLEHELAIISSGSSYSTDGPPSVGIAER